MKQLLALGFVFVCLTACQNAQQPSQQPEQELSESGEPVQPDVTEPGWTYYGEKTTTTGANSVPQMINAVETVRKMGKEEVNTKFTGTVDAVCQKKGCWMTILAPDSSTLRVTFKDYGFFVPMDIAGKTAIMEGKAYYDTVSVETLRHFAEDEGKSEEEIQAITEAEVKLAFEASGVMIKE